MLKNLAFCLLFFSCNCLAVPIYTEFVGGINTTAIQDCQSKTQNMCDKNNILNYRDCLKSAMQNEPSCSQNLALLNLKPKQTAEFNNITQFSWLWAVEAKITEERKILPTDPPNTKPYKESLWYFIVDNNGEFIDTDIIQTGIQDSTMYPKFIKMFPNATVQRITPGTFPPSLEQLPDRGLRLVFERQVTDGCGVCQTVGVDECKVCTIIGTTEQGYDFNRNGTYRWVKFLKLVPAQNVNI
jgi:hypothetical protein